MGRRGLRAVVVTTDPATLPDHTTWYLATNLPARDADLAEVVRLYGLRMWVEQAYKHTKHALGWAQHQVRSDAAIRRHWQLVCCAFTFCWRQWPPSAGVAASAEGEDREEPAVDAAAGPGKIRGARPPGCWPMALRAVRAWLEPWVLLRRYRRAWSPLPPPPPLAALLDRRYRGHGLDLYAPP